jgi:hypothetical protein
MNMTKIKVSEAYGIVLDWLVAKSEGKDKTYLEYFNSQWHLNKSLRYSRHWESGGPIIEREKLELRPGLYHSEIWACWGQTQHGDRNTLKGKTGPTPLIAAMRCYVCSKLGETVEVPDELYNTR